MQIVIEYINYIIKNVIYKNILESFCNYSLYILPCDLKIIIGAKLAQPDVWVEFLIK
jgi:hypothetical protein